MKQLASQIDDIFERCRADQRAAFLAFLTAGYPSLDRTAALMRAAAEGGADIIEVGFPYSDPLADGPIIQASSHEALEHGATFDAVLAVAARAQVRTPMIAFTYYHPLLVRGLERSAADLRRAGFAGALVPDLPPEEAGPLTEAFHTRGLTVTFVVAPTTPLERAATVAQATDGFLYVAGRMGVTGTHQRADESIESRIAALRKVTGKPLAVGFGIANPDQAREIAAHADGFVVGSALVEACAREEPVIAVRELCACFRERANRRR